MEQEIKNIDKALKKITSDFIGQQNNKTTKEALNSLVSGSLSNLQDKNILSGFNINYCETKHNRKNFFGKISDWVRWKSPLHRFFYKPKYVEINVVDIFQRLWDDGRLDVSEKEFDKMCDMFAGIKTWEERYPQSPYTIMDVSVNITPTKPLEYVKMDVVLNDGEVNA